MIPSPSPLNVDPQERIAGVLIPSFALRSGGDLGIGDVGSLRRFVDWAAHAGFALVQLLPINETGGDNSPYNAISSMALDPTSLELTPAALQDLTAQDCETEVAGAQSPPERVETVHYPTVKRLKHRLLQRAFARFTHSRAKSPARGARLEAFAEFQRRQAPWLEAYTLFRALMEENGGTECWDRWPTEQSTQLAALGWLETLPPRKRAALARNRQFFAYVQWIAYGQWEALKRHAESRGVALMGDIPLGVSYYSADFFGNPEGFQLGWYGGAPPEPYFKDHPFTQKWGQNWGIPVYDWDAMRQNGYAWWRQRVAGVRDLFHVFRIDHILGFYRIYSFPWRPERNGEFLPLNPEEARAITGGELPRFKPRADETSADREANRREGDVLLRMVLEAAGETRLIGEDLGTVPDYVRPNLTALGIAGFKIPIWEPDPRTGGLLPGADYSRLSVATYGTHDHEPLLALWTRWHHALDEHREDIHHLGEFAGIPHDERLGAFTPLVQEKLLAGLLNCNSWIAISMITDLLGRNERFNVPGTAADSNWSRRLHLTVEELAADADLTARLRRAIEASGRRVPAR